jgi:demethylmenaquinone methyltransferase/2-methoxy-6-polyprenyl-1,4-benzoquinol methylase
MGQREREKQENTTTPLESGPLPSPERKAVYVREMFGRIARRYDLMNRLMTFGRDGAWRRYTVAELGLGTESSEAMLSAARPPRVLDMATGTGDLALETLRQRPAAQVVGLDFVPEMLQLAQQKVATFAPVDVEMSSAGSVLLLAGDALKIPFADGLFDAVVTGFALRNVTDIPAAFAEMARVTRSGGRVACLEIAKPRTPLLRQLFALYFYRLVPMLGGLISGQRAAYTYLPHSLTAFLTPDEIAEVMRQTGWHDVKYRRLMFGTVAVHVGVRA